jgi:hypothetical protein
MEPSMTKFPTLLAELSHRVQVDIDHFDGIMPETTAAAWRGYLAAMIEWNLIPVDVYDEIVALVPRVKGDPAVAILTGRE